MKSIRSLPFLKLLIPLLFGILLGNYALKAPWYYYLFFYAYSLLLFYVFHRLRSSGSAFIYIKAIALFLHILCLGIFITKYHSSRFENTEDLIQGRVYLLTENWTKKKNYYTAKAEILTDRKKSMVLLRLKSESCPDGKSGDILLSNTLAYPIKEPQNPLQFNYKSYLKSQDIAYTLYLKEGHYLSIPRASTRIADLFSHSKEKLINSLNSMPLDKRSNAFIKALLLGDKSSLDPSTKKAFSIAGATHVLAVSGLHVGIIVSLFSVLLNFLLIKVDKRKTAWLKSILLLVVIWIYAGITDFSPSILRASVMFSFLSIGLSLTRHSNIYNTISIAAFFMLIINPDNLYAVGFQLSFLAVLGIVYFYPRLSRLFYFKNRLIQKTWNLCAVSIGAQITTFPLALYYFHQFPSYFLLSNLVVIPAAFIVLLLSILLLSFSWIPYVIELLSFALNKIISVLHLCIHFIEKLPFSSVQHVYVSLAQLFLLLGTLLFLTFFLNTKNVRHLYSSLFVCTLFFAAKIQHQLMTHQKQQVLVYSIAQETAIHIIDHLDHVLIFDYSAKDGIKKLSYASANFLQYKGLSSLEEATKIQLNEPNALVKPFLISSKNHLITHNTIMCLNHSTHCIKFKHLFKNRLLLKTEDLVLDSTEILNYSHLIDNVWNKVKNPSTTLFNGAIFYHKIKRDGYFLIDLNK